MSTHRGGKYVLSLLPNPPTKADADALVLTASASSGIKAALHEDAKDYLYAACVSIVDGIQGCERGLYSWATVKCYYSVYYALRARLASDGFCLFYVKKPTATPFRRQSTGYWINASLNARPFNAGSGSHQAVISLFQRENRSHRLVANPIETLPALNWLMERREDSNYNMARFIEPGAPRHFAELERSGVRNLLTRYMADSRDLYTFAVDHAMLAYPLATLVDSAQYLQGRAGVGLIPDELAFLVDRCIDDTGAITALTNFLATLT